ncbi:uncharacterized protein LOC144921016 isoform X3 [Branchiostoma floridae x Branchiostoma belcheri]
MKDTGVQNKKKWPGCAVSMTPVKLAVGVAVLVVVVSVILQPSDAQQEDESLLAMMMKSNKEETASIDGKQGDRYSNGPWADHEEPERLVKRSLPCWSCRVQCRWICTRYCRSCSTLSRWWYRRRPRPCRTSCCSWSFRCDVN